MNLLDVHAQFKSEEDCLDYLEQQRWPNGVRCLACEGERVSRYESHGKTGKPRRVYECLECGLQFTAKNGTLFHDSHLPLQKWFLAIALIVESKKGISASQVARAIGVQYKTAWYLCHRIREAMRDKNPEKLDGIVEIDETYVGGKGRGTGIGKGTIDKAVVVGIRQRNGELRFRHVPNAKEDTLYSVIADNVSNKVEQIMTDELPAYNFSLTQYRGKHSRIRHKDRVYVRGTVHTNTVESAFSLLKRGIVGTYHRLSHKHLERYLNEFEYRFNRRDAENLMFVEVLRDLTKSSEMPYQKLIS